MAAVLEPAADTGRRRKSDQAADLHREFRGAGSTSAAPNAMVAFLDASDRVAAVKSIRATMARPLLKRRIPQVDVALLDAACGTGTETRRLAGLLPGRVVGLDHNQQLLDVAAARAAADDVPPISWLCADMRHTGLPDGSVASIRVERGLIYLADADVAVSEFARMLAPGGVLVAYELDYGGLVLPAGNAGPRLLRELHALMESALPAPWAGRHAAGWMAAAGLTDVTVSPMTICTGPEVADRIVGNTVRTAVAEGRLDPDALAWLDSLAREPFAVLGLTVLGFVTTAVKPR